MVIEKRQTIRRGSSLAFGLLSLAALAAGSALLALEGLLGFRFATGDIGDTEARVIDITFIWPPTILVTWALGTAAILIGNRPVALRTFWLMGRGAFFGGWFLLVLTTDWGAAFLGIGVLLTLNCLAWLFAFQGARAEDRGDALRSNYKLRRNKSS